MLLVKNAKVYAPEYLGCGSTLFKKKGQLYCAKEGCGFVKAIEKK